MNYQATAVEQLRFQRELLETRITRVVLWSAISHGAALVAITNLIGNVEHPDHAFRALAPALLCFGLGLAASGWLGEVGRRTAEIGKAKAKFFFSFEAVRRLRVDRRHHDYDLSALAGLDAMLRLAGADPVDPNALSRIFEDPEAELLRYNEERRVALKALKEQSRSALYTSSGLFASGLIYIFVALGLGWKTLQPPENPRPAAAQSAAPRPGAMPVQCPVLTDPRSASVPLSALPPVQRNRVDGQRKRGHEDARNSIPTR